MEQKQEQKCVDCAFYIANKPYKDHYCPMKQPYIEEPEKINNCNYFGYSVKGLFDGTD